MTIFRPLPKVPSLSKRSFAASCVGQRKHKVRVAVHTGCNGICMTIGRAPPPCAAPRCGKRWQSCAAPVARFVGELQPSRYEICGWRKKQQAHEPSPQHALRTGTADPCPRTACPGSSDPPVLKKQQSAPNHLSQHLGLWLVARAVITTTPAAAHLVPVDVEERVERADGGIVHDLHGFSVAGPPSGNLKVRWLLLGPA